MQLWNLERMRMEQQSEDSEKKIVVSGLDKKTKIQSTIKRRVSSPIVFPSGILWPEFKMTWELKGVLGTDKNQGETL